MEDKRFCNLCGKPIEGIKRYCDDCAKKRKKESDKKRSIAQYKNARTDLHPINKTKKKPDTTFDDDIKSAHRLNLSYGEYMVLKEHQRKLEEKEVR